MSKLYSYVKIHLRYVAFPQNPVALAWLLYWNGKSLDQPRNSIKRFIAAVKDALRLVKRQIQVWIGRLDPDLIIELPFSGEVCLSVSNGYKVFDLKHYTVVKLFHPNVDIAVIHKEIDLNLKVRSLGLGNLFQDWNLEERWYEESYINSHHLRFGNWTDFSETLYRRVIPLTAQILSAAPTASKNLLEYSKHLQDQLFSTSGKLSNHRLDLEKVERIKQFSNSVISKLEIFSEAQSSVTLVLTHGDLSLFHILDQPGHDVIIDWEYMNYRSVLFDLHNVFFQEWTHREPSGMSIDLADVADCLESHLRKHNNLSESNGLTFSASADLYRWLYYLEHLCQAVEMRTPNDRKLRHLLQWIDGFIRYEERFISCISSPGT